MSAECSSMQLALTESRNYPQLMSGLYRITHFVSATSAQYVAKHSLKALIPPVVIRKSKSKNMYTITTYFLIVSGPLTRYCTERSNAARLS